MEARGDCRLGVEVQRALLTLALGVAPGPGDRASWESELRIGLIKAGPGGLLG